VSGVDDLMGDLLRRRIAAAERQLAEEEQAQRKVARIMHLALVLCLLAGLAALVSGTGR
jgi:cytochrome b561